MEDPPLTLLQPRRRATSRAYSLLREYSIDLLSTITEPLPVAWELFAKHVIEKFTVEKVQALGLARFQQVSYLLEGVLLSIEGRPELLDVALDVLASSSPAAGEVVEKMRLAIKLAKSDEQGAGSKGKSKNIVIPVSNTVHREFKQLRCKFTSIFCRIWSYIQKELQSSTYPQLEDLKNYLHCYNPHLSQELESNDLFKVLRRVSSPTNTDLLESMLKEYELNQAYELIKQYHEEEETFKRKLLDKEFAQELLDEMSSYKPESEIQINLKLQWQSSDDTTVKEFHDILNDAFSSFTRYIHLLEVKRGCVHCVCRAPRLLEEVLVKLGREGVERLKGRGVGLLVIGDIVILDETGKKEEEKENRPVSVNTNVHDEATQQPMTLTVTMATPQPLPQEVTDLHSHLSHNSCCGDPSNCMNCCKIDRGIKRLLSVQSSNMTSDAKPHLLSSHDEGLGRSISKEAEETEGEREREEEEEEVELGEFRQRHMSLSAISRSQMYKTIQDEEEEERGKGPLEQYKSKSIDISPQSHVINNNGGGPHPVNIEETVSIIKTIALPPISETDTITVTAGGSDNPVISSMSPPPYSSHPNFVRRSSSNYDSGIGLNPPSDRSNEEREGGGGVGRGGGGEDVIDGYAVTGRQETEIGKENSRRDGREILNK